MEREQTVQFKLLIELMSGWAEGWEAYVLSNGISLNDEQIEDAKIVGVARPDLVRVLEIPSIPLPPYDVFYTMLVKPRIISPEIFGLTLGFGVMLNTSSWGNRRKLAHELTHVAQYERLGGIKPGLRQYVSEALSYGYECAPMEQEAVNAAEKIFEMMRDK